MSRFLRLIALAWLTALLPAAGWAFDLGFAKEDGGQAGAFLDYAASARSMAMGRAHTGVAEDASATYWNPAGLSQLDQKDIVTVYSMLQEKTGFGFFSYAQPALDMGTFGVSVVSLRSGNFEKRNALGNKEGAFDIAETGVLFSHGIVLQHRIAVGTTLKYVRQDIDAYSDSGYGADIGAMIPLTQNLRMGLSIHNVLAPELRLRSASDKYPRDVRLGLKYVPGSRWVLAADMSKSSDRSLKPHLGAEWMMNETVALRTGLNETEVTAGLGVKFGDWGLDYAFGFHDAVKGVEDLGSTHRFGLHLAFGRKISEQGQSVYWQNKGKVYLEALRRRMESGEREMTSDMRKLIAGAQEVIRRQGFTKPEDLYAAHGYIYFFEKEYERGVQSLGESLALDRSNMVLAKHLELARDQMTEERTREIIETETKTMKELYDKGDLHGAIRSGEKILSFQPENIEAAAYLEDARKRVNEPIERAMKIARMKMERGEYLGAVKDLSLVKEMDPDNKEAAEMIGRAIAELEKQAVSETPSVGEQKRFVQEVARDTEKSRSLYSQGLLLYSQGKLQDATAAWEQAVRYDVDNVHARNAYNRVLTELKAK